MKKVIFFILFILIITLSFFKKEYTYSFYHWENTFKENILDKKQYIKILDIDYSNKLEIIKTNFIKPPTNFIPVIYISNEAMKKVNFNKLEKEINAIIKSYNFTFKELQIDCDWNLSSKYNYFEFLKKIKEKLNKKISTTIRLHQIKYYTKTGVPPVDYGVLMYYNMSDISNIDTKNSILDNKIAKKYHYNFDTYPLKLKLALPLYSQAIWFRNKKALSIFEGVIEKDFNSNFKKLENNKYKVLKSFYFKGRYIYKEDILRFENSNYKDIQIAIKDFFKLSKNSFNEIIFYTSKYKNKYNLDNLIKDFND